MAKELTTDLTLDGHLKVIKSGEEISSLELTSSGNGARINGDLEVIGTSNSLNFKTDSVTRNVIVFSSGDIILDGGGNFIAKKAGTEFSAANSAYAGMILGYTAIGIDVARDSVVVGGSFAVTDADHYVKFTAPPSGKVEIEVSIYAKATQTRWLAFGLSDNSTYSAIDFPNSDDVTNEHIIADVQVEGFAREFIHKWVVEGLTAGTTYTWYLGANSEVSGRITLYWGGNVTEEYAPFTMKATALPATIFDGT